MSTGSSELKSHHSTAWIDQPCEGFSCPAGDNVPRWLCVPCSSTYCDICWERQGPHRPGKVSLDSRLHEKTNGDVYHRFKGVFDSTLIQALPDTALWLAAKSGTQLDQCCQQTSRYSETITLASNGRPLRECTPSFISFVGQAGSGTSTVVKLLVASASTNEPDRRSLSRQLSTSEASSGVSLYSRPARPGNRPVLYADCKGLTSTSISSEPGNVSQHRRSTFGSSKFMPSLKRKDSVNFPSQWLVDNVFNRLLYTVSNVVVFVLRDTIALDITTLTWILDLASNSLDFSFDQVPLPHAIFVLNTYNPPSLTETYDEIEALTYKFFFSNPGMPLNESPLAKYYDLWQRRSKVISHSSDLLKCYFSGIKVVALPHKEKVTLLDSQIRALDQAIMGICDVPRPQERPNAEEFQTMFNEALNHFLKRPSLTLTRMPLEIIRYPVFAELPYHISTLARLTSGRMINGVLIQSQIFSTIAPLVASCIHTRCIRYRQPGLPLMVFDKILAPLCVRAVQLFRLEHNVCQYQYSELRCMLKEADHSSTHWMQNGTRRQGNYVKASDFDKAGWLSEIKNYLVPIRSRLLGAIQQTAIPNGHSTDMVEAAYVLHREEIVRFFQGFTTAPTSRFTCFGCLVETSKHELSCGHSICTTCARYFGRAGKTDLNTVCLESCPFEGKNPRTFRPCTIRIGRERMVAEMPAQVGPQQYAQNPPSSTSH